MDCTGVAAGASSGFGTVSIDCASRFRNVRAALTDHHRHNHHRNFSAATPGAGALSWAGNRSAAGNFMAIVCWFMGIGRSDGAGVATDDRDRSGDQCKFPRVHCRFPACIEPIYVFNQINDIEATKNIAAICLRNQRLRIRPGGVALLEIGLARAAAVLTLANTAGMAGTIKCDLGGRDRCLVLRVETSA